MHLYNGAIFWILSMDLNRHECGVPNCLLYILQVEFKISKD